MTATPATITIYGAGTDRVVVEGESREVYTVDGPTEFLVVAPDGLAVTVTAEFGDWGWNLSVSLASAEFPPPWPIRFGPRPDHPDHPKVTIDVPDGTVVRGLRPS